MPFILVYPVDVYGFLPIRIIIHITTHFYWNMIQIIIIKAMSLNCCGNYKRFTHSAHPGEYNMCFSNRNLETEPWNRTLKQNLETEPWNRNVLREESLLASLTLGKMGRGVVFSPWIKGSGRLCKVVELSMQCCGKLLSDSFETN